MPTLSVNKKRYCDRDDCDYSKEVGVDVFGLILDSFALQKAWGDLKFPKGHQPKSKDGHTHHMVSKAWIEVRE